MSLSRSEGNNLPGTDEIHNNRWKQSCIAERENSKGAGFLPFLSGIVIPLKQHPKETAENKSQTGPVPDIIIIFILIYII